MEAPTTSSNEASFTTSAKWILHAFALAWNLISTILELVFQVIFSHKGDTLNLQDFDPLKTVDLPAPTPVELPIDVLSSSSSEGSKDNSVIELISNVPDVTQTSAEIVAPPQLQVALDISEKSEESSSDDESIDRPSGIETGKIVAATPDGEGKKKRKRRRGKKKKATQDGSASPDSVHNDDSKSSTEKKPAQPKTPKDKTPVKEKPAKSPLKEKMTSKSPAKNGDVRSNWAKPTTLFPDSAPRRFSHSVLKTSPEDSASLPTIRPIRQPIGPTVGSNGFSAEYRKSRLAALTKANSEQFLAKNQITPIAKALSV